MRGEIFVVLMIAALTACSAEIGGVLNPREDDASITHADAQQSADAGTIFEADASLPDISFPDATAAPDAEIVTPPDSWPAAWSAREDAMLILVNQLRSTGTSCGARNYPAVPALAMNAELREAARLHSKDMADQNYFDHNSLDGRDPWDRIREAQYSGFGVGENIAAGNSSAEGAFEQWVNSPGHCSNMMSSEAREIGVGYASNGSSTYEHYWTQTFGR